MPEAVRVIEGWRWPKVDATQIDAINKSMAKGMTLFCNVAPVCETRLTLRTKEPYKTVTSTGYGAVRIAKLCKDGRRVYLVRRLTRFSADYEAACEEAGEEPRLETYVVDMDYQCCTCLDCKRNDYRWCKHLLGLAYWLARPHHHTQSGLVVWEPHTLEEVYWPGNEEGAA